MGPESIYVLSPCWDEDALLPRTRRRKNSVLAGPPGQVASAMELSTLFSIQHNIPQVDRSTPHKASAIQSQKPQILLNSQTYTGGYRRSVSLMTARRNFMLRTSSYVGRRVGPTTLKISSRRRLRMSGCSARRYTAKVRVQAVVSRPARRMFKASSRMIVRSAHAHQLDHSTRSNQRTVGSLEQLTQ